MNTQETQKNAPPKKTQVVQKRRSALIAQVRRDVCLFERIVRGAESKKKM
jgi:hypothetical protein